MTDRIGFIGLGRLGSAIVRRFAEQGVKPVVWNRDAAKAAALKDTGVVIAKSPGDLTAQVDVVFACVHDAAAVEDILFKPSGVAATGNASRLFVDMSTIGPVATQQMAPRLIDQCGMAWCDAPVSGGVPGAQSGKLIVMAGGATADVDRIRPILAHVAQKVDHVGPVGSGQAMKAINQLIIGGYVAIVAEALSLASRYGLSAANVPDVLKGGLADSTILQNQGKRMAAPKLEKSGSAGILVKDLDIAGSMASAAGQSLPVGSLVAQLYRMQVSMGHDALGMIGLAQLYRSGNPQ